MSIENRFKMLDAQLRRGNQSEILFSTNFGGETLALAAARAVLTRLRNEPIMQTMYCSSKNLGDGPRIKHREVPRAAFAIGFRTPNLHIREPQSFPWFLFLRYARPLPARNAAVWRPYLGRP